ncbi:aminoacylase-1-like isoform X2 [Leguminivora glycinivorella]|uniref:aminoacylase-1-like isoform X2 n=1 Tax=Leguminivora glycinivorella TaxID=1035111 RepID=UPI00200E40C6|nr:aminoacylase-1-like isoform X2 [Leguminivora glycinivorella]
MSTTVRNLNGCVEFLKRQANELDLPMVAHELVPGKPVVVITWEGKDPRLPAILLNSHMDVVPVYEECWTHPPFEAKISEEGYIYARGTQDMKSVGMFHLEAVRRLKAAGVRLKRTVHVSFVPDEEIGGEHGMKAFAQSEQFKALNVGFGLDESCPTTNSKVIQAFNGEKTNRQLKVTCRGKPGHGSLLQPNTAGEKLHFVLDRFMMYRAGEMQKQARGGWVGDLVTINLTQIEGGVQINVLPESLSLYFDVRIPPTIDHDDFDNMIRNWCREAGEDVTFEYVGNNASVEITNIDESNQFWTALLGAVREIGYDIHCRICPGTTDARFVRQQGIPVINFTPILNSPVLLHAHDERIHVEVFRRGIAIMEKVVEAVANI